MISFVYLNPTPRPTIPTPRSVSARAMTGRLESVDFLVAAAVFLGHTTSAWVGANALLTVVGVVLAVLYPLLAPGGQADPHSLVGYLYLVAGGWGYTLSLVITKRYLMHIPVGLLSLFKVRYGVDRGVEGWIGGRLARRCLCLIDLRIDKPH